MLTHLRDQIIDLSIEGAKKLVQENLKIDPDKQRQMLIEMFTGIRDRKFLAVPQELQSNLPRIEVTTAIALTDEEQGARQRRAEIAAERRRRGRFSDRSENSRRRCCS